MLCITKFGATTNKIIKHCSQNFVNTILFVQILAGTLLIAEYTNAVDQVKLSDNYLTKTVVDQSFILELCSLSLFP
jgi:hypothetical protein